MQTLIMLSNAGITVSELVKTLTPEYSPAALGTSGFVVQSVRPNGTIAYVRVRKLDNPAAEYDEADNPPFSVSAHTKGFLIEFNDLSFLKTVARLLLDRGDVAVDDDHGNIVLGSDFVVGLQNSSALGWLAPDYET